ncbi:radical SAM protein [Candidatus Woesearchaeota archaeon]|nr:radical SAM protein [Candidatus Woesearchaeota archaeon]
MSRNIRKPLVNKLDKLMYENIVEKELNYPKSVQEKKYQFAKAMLSCTLRNIDKGYFSKNVANKIVNSLVAGAFLGEKNSLHVREQFRKKYGESPPGFLVLSPTQKCNLNCEGCYAACRADTTETLPYDIVEKIVDEAYHSFGNRFMTISGGEPFLYRNKGKTLFDIWKKYPDMFFLVYTNGTFITNENAKKLSELGNVTPAISVEGFKAETDERRGKGIHDNILKAFENLRQHGVPFGISVTATNKNVDILLEDEFYDFYFEQQGATYMWKFQLMPIGRARQAKEIMVTPRQRVELYHKWKYLLEKKQYLIADFWNSGVLSDGCIAYGRDGGYLYIDWNGNIMPCVFVPYYVDNIKDLLKQGKSIRHALFSQFFKNGRNWQNKYGLKNSKHPHNWLMPCSIRDHYKHFREKIITSEVKSENEEAGIAINSEEYSEVLENFDKELDKLTKGIWKTEYLQPQKVLTEKKQGIA